MIPVQVTNEEFLTLSSVFDKDTVLQMEARLIQDRYSNEVKMGEVVLTDEGIEVHFVHRNDDRPDKVLLQKGDWYLITPDKSKLLLYRSAFGWLITLKK